MVLNDLVDSFCYSQKNAGLKGLIASFVRLCLSALLEKQLKREKKTRRQLQQRLRSGDGDDGSHGQGLSSRSMIDDGTLRVRVSNANDVLASAYQITGLSFT